MRVDGSESVSCGRVDDAICRVHEGVEVPIPTKVFNPPFTHIALVNAPVEVANLEFPPPPPAPSSEPSQRVAEPVRATQVAWLLPKVTVLVPSILKAKLVEVANVDGEEVAR